MRTRIVCLLLAAALAALCAGTAAAASGFEIGALQIADGFADTVTVTVLDASGRAAAANSAGRYPDAAKLRVQYRGAVSGANYVVFLQSENAAPTEGNLLCIDQQTATAQGATFTLSPRTALPEGVCYLAISGNGGSGIRAKTTVASFRAYRVPRCGDVNEDGAINAKDVTTLRRYLAGGYGVTVKTITADVLQDGVVNAKDVANLRRYLTGGYGVVLP